MLPPDGMNLGPYLGPPAAVKARIVDPQPEVLPGPEAAREEGDLRENGGYHTAKDEQGQTRIHE